MISRRWSQIGESRPVVASLMALRLETAPVRSQFEVMVRHLYDRMLNNEVFGEDASARVAELSYAIALPGVLVALFLFPAYHGLPPYPVERSFWSQACDHLFFVTYAFVVMGCTVIFQWEMVFPDALDVSVMTTLPISLRRLLTGRVAAGAMFLLLVHAGTSGLGCVFLPAVADQRCGFARQVLAQAIAVSMGAVCLVSLLVTMQAVLLWLPKGRVAEMARGAVRVVLLTGLMTLLFLFPLTAHYLDRLLDPGSRSVLVRGFPTFWFLGVYESVMWGAKAPPVFHALAKTGVFVTTVALLSAACSYPLGYLRRVRQLVEGSPMAKGAAGLGWVRAMMHGVVFRKPKTRATAHLATQTLLRNERLHLYLAMYVGLGTALVLSGVVAIRMDGRRIRLVMLEAGLRMAVPVVAFWAVAGVKTALLSPVGRRGGWIFRAIGGEAGAEELDGGRLLTVCVAWGATLAAIGLLDALAGRGVPGARALATQVVFGCALPIILAELFFVGVRSVPFTGAGRRSVNQLPLAFVQYFVVFPAFVLSIATWESWAAISAARMAWAAAALGGAYVVARALRLWVAARPAAEEEMILVVFHAD